MGYELPQIREPGGGVDWRQILDFLIPGNVWNSRTNEYRPIGIASGVASMVGGPLAGAAVELGGSLRGHMPQMPQFGNPFSGMGQNGSVRGRAVREPLRYADDTSAISNAAASHTPGPWAGQAPMSDARIAALEQSMGAQPQRSGGGTPMRGGVGGYNGMSISSARGLGESQRRSNESIMADQMAFLENMRGHRGALMEQ